MPIYEFYCYDCHTVFQFLSRRASVDRKPRCPKCGEDGMQRKASTFSISKGRSEPSQDPLEGLDETRMEQVMGSLAREMEGVDEEDPRAMGRFVRKLYEASGLGLGPGLEAALRRLEAGEDPDKIEEELGDLLEQEVPGAEAAGGGWRGLRRRIRPPDVDPTLYEL